MKDVKICLSTTVAPTTLQTLDEIRGLAPRSRIVEMALLQYFERELHKSNHASGVAIKRK